MKIIIALLLTLITGLLTNATSSEHVRLQPPVLDTDGNPLLRKGLYYIMPAVPDTGGPWNLQSVWDLSICPVYLGQFNATKSDGTDFLAASFSPSDGDDEVVRLHTNTEVRFAGEQCGTELVWRVEQGWLFVEERRRIMMRPDRFEPFNSYFKIKRREGFENEYSFYWCPLDVCRDYICFVCSSLGLEILELEGTKTRLFALDGLRGDFPYATDFPVVFQRVYFTNDKYY